MDLITPGIGLVFWTTLVFVILLLLLKKLAWKPILEAVEERENKIENALKSAELAKKEMESLKAGNEKLIQEARIERDNLLREARELKEGIVAKAKEEAQNEANKILNQAREMITNEKNAAMAEVKNQLAKLSIDIAEKIIREKLNDDAAQKAKIESFISDLKLN
jgi:F-type H+-transporting ATPase subunit b